METNNMKKLIVLLILFSFVINLNAQNFSLVGRYFPNPYSTIDIFDIKNNEVIYHFETTNENYIVNYNKLGS